MLIDADVELVNKVTLLKTLWDDVVVDEQVIFQSLKELRKRQRGFYLDFIPVPFPRLA